MSKETEAEEHAVDASPTDEPETSKEKKKDGGKKKPLRNVKNVAKLINLNGH